VRWLLFKGKLPNYLASLGEAAPVGSPKVVDAIKPLQSPSKVGAKNGDRRSKLLLGAEGGVDGIAQCGGP
jgi:hypothetical protein